MGRIGQEKGLDKEPDTLTGPEMEVVTVVFHQFETGLREGTIYTRVISLLLLLFTITVTIIIVITTVNPLITNTSEEFIKCRLDHFSTSFILYFVNFSI